MYHNGVEYIDWDDPEPYDEEEEHPYTCICPECAYWEWLLFDKEQRDELPDDWEPPF